MADRAVMRKFAFRLLVAGLVVIAVACGTTGEDRSTGASSTSTTRTNASEPPSSVVTSSHAPSSVVTSSDAPLSVVPPSTVTTVPSDPAEAVPAGAAAVISDCCVSALERATGEVRWTRCGNEWVVGRVAGAPDSAERG
jgi:hypothetical protein